MPEPIISINPPACCICDTPMNVAFTGTFLGRHKAPYDHCPRCGFLQVRSPFWLDEAYSDAIVVSDTGILQRNLHLADALGAFLPKLGNVQGPFLDFGGGLGLLVRIMRDRGFGFFWADAHAKNEVARGFEYSTDIGPCLAVTAFEVLEHVANPITFISEALTTGACDTLIFSTELYSGDLPPSNWWYFAREGGQHIGFYRRDTLAAIGHRLGLSLASSGMIHVLSRREISDAQLRRATSRLGRLFGRWQTRRRIGLTGSDHELMTARLRSDAEL